MAQESEVAQAFGRRLVELMKSKGFTSDRNRSGVDVAALAKGAIVSYEMARRYVEGTALPRPDVLRAIAAWLSVDPAELAYGTQGNPAEVDPEMLTRCLQAVTEAQRTAGVTISEEQAARVVAQLYREAIRGEPVSSNALAAFLRAMTR